MPIQHPSALVQSGRTDISDLPIEVRSKPPSRKFINGESNWAKRKLEDQRRRLAEQERELRELRQQSQHLERRAQTAEQTTASMLRSSSWKLTRPFRAAASKFPGLTERSKQLLFGARSPGRTKIEQGADKGSALAMPARQSFHGDVDDSPSRLHERLSALEHELAVLKERSLQERRRLDWTVGTVEGIEPLINEYQRDRATIEYQSAFRSTEPLVSVCIATLNNSEELVEGALASLLAQTYRNLQIIVVGDHCVDDTPLRVARLHDNRITFFNLPERGPYPESGYDRWCVAGTNAMNHALSLCEGAFITHLDDDDRMSADRIEILLSAARDAKADFVWHPFWYEHADGKWQRLGGPGLDCGTVTTGSIFYHHWFKRIRWDVRAYLKSEPGDWQRIRRIKMLRPHRVFVDRSMLFHHAEGQRRTYPYPQERFLT